MVIGVSLAFCSTDQEKIETARSLKREDPAMHEDEVAESL